MGRSGWRRGFLVLLLVLGSTSGPSSAGAAAVTTKEIEEALTCQCGCGLTVHSCNHLQCGSAIPLKQEVLTLVNQGLSRDEILLRFRGKYGEKILSAPTAEGFNLTAWVLPFVMLAGGMGLVAATLVRWRAARASAGTPATAPAAISDADRRRIEAELAKGES
jgi:cytochrome c-type biogenesis protein CcmH